MKEKKNKIGGNGKNQYSNVVTSATFQFGRRNLSNYQRSVLALELEEVFSIKAKENLILGAEITNTGLQKSVKAVNTQKELSKVASVSHDTIAKVKKIQEKAPEEVKG